MRDTLSYLTDDPTAGPTIASRGAVTRIALMAGEAPAVHRAVADLRADLARVCDADAVITGEPDECHIVVGTLGFSPLIEAAVARGELDVAALHHPDGGLHWEGYLLQTVGNCLYIVGTDRRGTVFGIYDLCETMGVSPWRWFADVPVRRREHVTVQAGTAVADHPTIRYRGIFLNDEEELEAWAREHTSDGTIGPETYARVFELLLRLKANYIWPAMHVNAFNADPRNGRLAQEMGVVVGTSHCDMLLRSNQNEWDPWLRAQGEHVDYDYSIPGRNREKLHEYWRDSIQQNRDYEVSWTLGMRGIHDSGFHTAAIDDDASLSEPEKAQARARLLERIIAEQRQLLRDELGGQRADGALQTFVPYKEVLPLYDAGLEIPDDVTIVWADDSFGCIRRFPDAAERQRSGGHGLYYHSSYWSPPPRSYLFISSTPLAHMKNELRKAYERGIHTLWVDNVGSLKPLEQDVEFFLRYAWEVGKESTTHDVTQFTSQWVDRNFTGLHGERAAGIYDEWAQITNTRKIEHLSSGAFSQTSYGDEARQRLGRLRELYDATNEILAALPEAEREAFFQLFAFKVHASYLTNAQFYYADRSTLAYEQGKMQSADHYLQLSRTFDGHKRAMLHYYNAQMSEGKWNSIATPEAFPPPTTALFPAARPALRIAAAGLGVLPWGARTSCPEPVLRFSPHAPGWKWIEVFNTGAGSIDYTITGESWIETSRSSGSVAGEQRIGVRVPEPHLAAGKVGQLMVHSATVDRSVAVTVRVDALAALEGGEAGAVEADGYVCWAATDAERHDGTTSQWVEVPRLGRGGGSLMEVRTSGPGHRPTEDSAEGRLSYGLHLTTPGAHLLELHRFPSLDSTGRIRVAVSVDDMPPVVLESPTTDEYRGAWTQVVVDNVEKLLLRLPYLDTGHHVLRLHAIDEWFAFSKVVVYTASRPDTALGPPPSPQLQRGGRFPSDPVPAGQAVPGAPDEPDLAAVETVTSQFYRCDPHTLPLRPVVYVDGNFWNSDTTFAHNLVVPQTALGDQRFRLHADGTKDVLVELGRGPIVERSGRIAIEAEYTLVQTADAYLTASIDEPAVTWTHTQAETNAGTGLAMHVDGPARRWEDPLRAPGLHFRLKVTHSGTYHVWTLVKFDSQDDDSCVLALDGTPQPVGEQFCGGDLFSFGTAQIWVWSLLSDLQVPSGVHTLSLYARKSRLRVDRLYLTLHDERPPGDAAWPVETVGRG
jgi:hypothetical protein